MSLVCLKKNPVIKVIKNLMALEAKKMHKKQI